MLIFPPHLCELAVSAQKRHFFKFRPQCDMVVGHFGKKKQNFFQFILLITYLHFLN